MHHYTTLFDSFYLSRGLIMYNSLKECTKNFHLYIFAFDDLSLNILRQKTLENVTVISLAEFETEELKEVKKSRSKAEYCWTCTPSVISYVLSNYNVPECTYIDADLVFYSDPAILISELEKYNKNVLITEHRFSFLPRLYEEKRAGKFCVQFMTFKNEEISLQVLDHWRKQCIEWCYARHEDGKFGDQKYLDEWPDKYENVHILVNEGGGLAPWNLQNYFIRQEAGKLVILKKKNNQKFDLVFYHFQYVKNLDNGIYDIGWYQISYHIKRIFYQPYITLIEKTEKCLLRSNPNYMVNKSSLKTGGFIKKILKKFLKFNIIRIN